MRQRLVENLDHLLDLCGRHAREQWQRESARSDVASVAERPPCTPCLACRTLELRQQRQRVAEQARLHAAGLQRFHDALANQRAAADGPD